MRICVCFVNTGTRLAQAIMLHCDRSEIMAICGVICRYPVIFQSNILSITGCAKQNEFVAKSSFSLERHRSFTKPM